MRPDYLYRLSAVLPSFPMGSCGVDEAGRGPLAGPVIAAAVLVQGHELDWARDSKQVSAHQRENWARQIRESVPYAIGSASVAEIDRLNILQASLLAMQRAVAALIPMPQEVWVDGLHAPLLEIPTRAVVKGDQRVAAISAASLVAKVARDDIMRELAERYPDYGFERHKGYGSAVHLAALHRCGPCAEHRRSFAPVKALLA